MIKVNATPRFAVLDLPSGVVLHISYFYEPPLTSIVHDDHSYTEEWSREDQTRRESSE